MDRPSPVQRLRASIYTKDSNKIELSWEPPKDQGGSAITHYLIEKRESNRRTWVPCGTVDQTIYVLDGLNIGNVSYFFRVMAQNTCGCSDPTETDKPLAIPCLTKPPSTPGQPEANDIGTDSCRVTWKPPESDGGARLTFYYLEKRANLKGNWVRTSGDKIPIISTDAQSLFTTKVLGLIADNVYEFRVAAENADFMVSEWSKPSHRISTQTPFSTPGKPSKPEIKSVTESTVTINWKAPYDDGGDTIKKYLIQYKCITSMDWQTESEMPIDLEFTVIHLKSNEEYLFRVAAINGAGQGPWSDSSESCQPAKALESAKPSLIKPLTNATILVGESVEFNCEFLLGDPKASISWQVSFL